MARLRLIERVDESGKAIALGLRIVEVCLRLLCSLVRLIRRRLSELVLTLRVAQGSCGRCSAFCCLLLGCSRRVEVTLGVRKRFRRFVEGVLRAGDPARKRVERRERLVALLFASGNVVLRLRERRLSRGELLLRCAHGRFFLRDERRRRLEGTLRRLDRCARFVARLLSCRDGRLGFRGLLLGLCDGFLLLGCRVSGRFDVRLGACLLAFAPGDHVARVRLGRLRVAQLGKRRLVDRFGVGHVGVVPVEQLFELR